MRVAIDGRAFESPAGGVRRYVGELFGAMAAACPDVELIAAGASPDARLPPGVHRAPAAASLPTNLGWASSGLPLSARAVRADVFHAPAYTAPLWGVPPIVLTIHDVSYARRPEFYPHPIDPVRRAFYRASARRAERVVTDSAFSRDEIVAAYGIDVNRIDVVPLAASAAFAPADVARERFVLHVGDLHARRNLGMLLEVVLELRTDARWPALKLVLAGVDRGVLARLQETAAARGAAAALEYVGQPDDAALASLYQRAAVFAYPSRYEGFGLPVLEAMACGAPVVATSAASVPEVAGAAAISADPDDARAWRDAIGAVLASSERAQMLSEAGRLRAAAFSWRRTAAETVRAYRRVGERR
ncbi:MAG TPA: glycosyltransferase family 1 protein [Vicinamibacterales bacterium]|nr:glycosyltransferase family 1 protein [Vicinamibacterales bacterium]